MNTIIRILSYRRTSEIHVYFYSINYLLFTSHYLFFRNSYLYKYYREYTLYRAYIYKVNLDYSPIIISSLYLPTSPYICLQVPISAYKSLYLPTSPYTCLQVPISAYKSLYLPTSPYTCL